MYFPIVYYILPVSLKCTNYIVLTFKLLKLIAYHVSLQFLYYHDINTT